MREAPAEMDEVEKSKLGERWIRTEPGLEVAVGSLPVLPTCGGFFHGAGLGARIVNVERFEDKINVAWGFFEVVEDEFGVFGEVKFSVEMTRFGGFSEI